MQKYNTVCRDYLRNCCRKSDLECRFEHPPRIFSNAVQAYSLTVNGVPLGGTQQQVFYPPHNFDPGRVSVCRDFARGSCPRSHCRFIHLTPSEVRHYATSGRLPDRIILASSSGLRLQSADVEALNGSVPLCRDYLRGVCTRRDGCRYVHLDGLTLSPSVTPNHGSGSNNSVSNNLLGTHINNSSSNDNNNNEAPIQNSNSQNTRNDVDLDGSPPLIKRMRATPGGMIEIQSPDYDSSSSSLTAASSMQQHSSSALGPNNHLRNALPVSTVNQSQSQQRRSSSVSILSPAGDHYDPFVQSPPFPSPSGSVTSGGSNSGGINHSSSVNNGNSSNNGNSNSNRRRPNNSSRPCSTCLSCNNLQSENRSLRVKVVELEKQVNNLTATNDVLLTQNAKLRSNKATPMVHNAVQNSLVTMPIRQYPHTAHTSVANNSNSGYLSTAYAPAPPPPPPVSSNSNNTLGGSSNDGSSFGSIGAIQVQNRVVPTAAAMGTVQIAAAHHPSPVVSAAPANVNAAAVPYFITQITPNFTPLNGANTNLTPAAAVQTARVSSNIQAATILPHPTNQVVAAAAQPAVAIAASTPHQIGHAHYTPTFLLPHGNSANTIHVSTSVPPSPAAAPSQLTVTTLSLTPFAAAAGYTGQLYNLRPASGTTYHLTPASAQTVCINALQAAPNMSPVVVAHTPSTLATQSGTGTPAAAVLQTVHTIQPSTTGASVLTCE